MPRPSALPDATRDPENSPLDRSLVNTRLSAPARSTTLIERGSHVGLPRRRPTDKTRHLDFAAVANLVNAVAFANYTGNRLGVGMTLIWSHVAGFREDRLSELTTLFLQRVARWLRRHAGIELRAVWIRERGREKGHHLHAMANIPVELVADLRDYLTRSFSITAGGLDFRLGVYGMKTPSMQMGYLRYCCKTFDHTAFVYRCFETHNMGDVLGIQHRGTDGVVPVKRAGTTENIARKARAAAGWKEARYLEQVANLLNQPRKRPA